MTIPQITVVITTYNLQPFISKSLDELISQTFQDFNILVVDDCSCDGTPNIVREYIQRFPGRITALFLEKNLGKPGLVRNAALDSGKINGEFVIFLDGDDSIEPDFLEILHDMASSGNTDMAVCAFDRVEFETGHILGTEMQGFPVMLNLADNGVPLKTQHQTYRRSDEADGGFSETENSGILAFINTAVWNKLIKTTLIEDIRFSDFSVGEEVCFLLRLYAKCKKMKFTDQVLIHYQERGSSVISNTKLADIQEFAEEFIKLHSETSDTNFRDTIEFVTFIHIGLSMALRAKANPDIPLRRHLSRTRTYFADHFDLFKSNSLLRLNSAWTHGFRGVLIWTCLLLYKMHCARLFLFAYELRKKITRKEFKF